MYVYILTNPKRTVLYIGVTNDLPRRLDEHSSGLGETGKFTGHYQCNLLVYAELLPDANQAIAREKQLKKWERAKKEALVESLNPTWAAIELETWDGGTEISGEALQSRLRMISAQRSGRDVSTSST
ncbi:GIY-YIG nuclease family protein [Hymenobacter ruricola]|uniref:GIY-YIG nuclease family protein n=1 Tax=Hymenobacter ruricola TaxID=2791023 RepID=A0ABS0I4P0_9BACT|nr:GIY-YIG nuclease family protein [Hymenobacter ruricola]MBF9221943.1 GIY-YIG nuclease family protein [Hymenobacter ruricola]